MGLKRKGILSLKNDFLIKRISQMNQHQLKKHKATGFLRILRAGLIPLLLTGIISGCFFSKPPEEFGNKEILKTNQDKEGQSLVLHFKKGKEHNFPLMAIWIEDTTGKYIETLYVAESIGTGIFNYGESEKGKWKPGEIRRPAALPYWAHKRGIKAADGLYLPTPENPVPDAITGETPLNDFDLYTRISDKIPDAFFVLFEINQTWDFNEYWTNNKFPDNEEYKTSCQPAVVYRTKIDKDQNPAGTLEAIGHSHYAGENGQLYPDLSTLTTALEIAEEIRVEFKRP